jgi:hypothetical protein
METYAEISSQLKEVRDKRKKLIEDALDGRTQQWLAERIGMNNTRLSHCINGLMEFSEDELTQINSLLKTDFQLNG